MGCEELADQFMIAMLRSGKTSQDRELIGDFLTRTDSRLSPMLPN
jgi:hypothetical protein